MSDRRGTGLRDFQELAMKVGCFILEYYLMREERGTAHPSTTNPSFI